MKKIFIYVFILTCIFIFCPSSNSNFNSDNHVSGKDRIGYNNSIMKMSYYIRYDNTEVYDKSISKHTVLCTLNKNEEVIGYYKKNGYVYCKDNKYGKFGWIKEKDLKDVIYKDTKYVLDIDLNTSDINIIKNRNIVKTIPYFLNDDQYDEIPSGVFYINGKGSYNYEGSRRYYVKFFSNYLIHSIPLDEKGNIIECRGNRFGFNIAYDSIRVSIQDSDWLFKFISDGSAVIIHY